MSQGAIPLGPSQSSLGLFEDPLPHILPQGGICLLIGAPNLGKTALLADIARAFRDGTPIFGHHPNPLPGMGIIAADRSWVRGARLWFERAGFPEIPVYSMIDDLSFDPRSLRRKYERTQRLAEFIDKLALPRGSLVYVDPISLFLGGNLIDYDACAVACHEIRQVLNTRSLSPDTEAYFSHQPASFRGRTSGFSPKPDFWAQRFPRSTAEPGVHGSRLR